MKQKTIKNRRTRRKVKGSSYAEKKLLQYRGIFAPSSPFFLAASGPGISLSQFKNLKYKTHNDTKV